MPRLPTPGGDNGNWGEILNEYLSVSLSSEGELVEGSVTRSTLADAVQDELDDKLENITGFVSPGSNVSMTGLGTLASPYQISASNSGGDVSGPGSSTLNAVPRFSGTGGKTLKDSALIIDDTGKIGVGVSSPANRLHLFENNAGVGSSVGLTIEQSGAGDAVMHLLLTGQQRFQLGIDKSDANKFKIGRGSDWFTGTDLTIDTTGNLGIGTAAPTHSLTLPSTATGSVHYNTTDQGSNYERVRQYWSSGVYFINSENTGTGTLRGIRIGNTGTYTLYSADVSKILHQAGGTASVGPVISNSASLTGTSGMQSMFGVNPVVNQSGTAGYTMLLVNPTETTTGSGAKLLADFQVGGVSKFKIDSTGQQSYGTGASVSLFNSADQTTNYERGRIFWASNTFQVRAEAGGTANSRSIQIGTTNRTFTINDTPSGGGTFLFNIGTSVSPTNGVLLNGAFSQTAGTNTPLAVDLTVNQSGTASYTGFRVNAIETTVGSGTKLLADFQIGGASKTRIDNTGSHILSNGASTYIYNTADETTNYERVTMGWSSNVFNIGTGALGTGTPRLLQLNGAGSVLTIGVSPAFIFSRNSTTAASLMQVTSTGLTASSGTQAAIVIDPTIGQSGTAGYSGLRVNITETATGSGAKYLIEGNIGGTQRFAVTNTGKVTATGGIKGRANTVAAAANVYTPAIDTTDLVLITTPAANFTVANPTGTPDDGQRLTVRIRSGTTGYAPTWGTSYMASGMTTLPTATLPVSKTVTFSFIYDSTPAKWVLLAADTVGY